MRCMNICYLCDDVRYAKDNPFAVNTSGLDIGCNVEMQESGCDYMDPMIFMNMSIDFDCPYKFEQQVIESEMPAFVRRDRKIS